MTHATTQHRVLVPLYVYLVVGVYQGLLGLYAGPIQALYDRPATSDVSYACVSLSISGHI